MPTRHTLGTESILWVVPVAVLVFVVVSFLLCICYDRRKAAAEKSDGKPLLQVV